jgi:hypothetical protein
MNFKEYVGEATAADLKLRAMAVQVTKLNFS